MVFNANFTSDVSFTLEGHSLATRCNYTLSSEDRFLCLPGEPDYLRKVGYHFAVVYCSSPVSYNSINMDVEK
jgi:hypothetical protein